MPRILTRALSRERARGTNARPLEPVLMPTDVTIESLDQEGRGVAHVDGKAVFVEGALPGERVDVEILKRKPSFEIARIATSAQPSAVARHAALPALRRLRRLHAAARRRPALQVAAKQRALEDALLRIGRVRAGRAAPARAGPAWGYRYRARLSVRDVAKKGGVLVGFHERKSSFVADMRECHVMPPKVSSLLLPLRDADRRAVARDRLPQIELAVGERDGRPRVRAGAAHPRSADI